MKIIQFLLATLLLFIGSIFSYEKVELNDNHVIEKPIIKEEIIEENISSEVIDDNEDITLIEYVESTKEEKTSTNTIKKESKIKTNSKKTQNKADKKQKEESVKEEKPKEKHKKEDTKLQCSDFYESITHGKVDKSSKSACVSYGNKIQNAELDEVLDYNEEQGNVKKPIISYFRCYEVVDSKCNTKGWYLHFFCNSGGCDDNKLKSLYG